jgi:hypothetical protein
MPSRDPLLFATVTLDYSDIRMSLLSSNSYDFTEITSFEGSMRDKSKSTAGIEFWREYCRFLSSANPVAGIFSFFIRAKGKLCAC